MTEPPFLAAARDLIRAGKYRPAVELLLAGVSEHPDEYHRKAYSHAGVAFYSNQEWAEAMSMFTVAAKGSEVPEDWFNVAMAQIRMGYPAGGLETWEKVFALSYAHQDAPETSTFSQKKLLFARALLDAGADASIGHPVGLDLLENQLLGFYTNNHTTDPHTWGIRGVPQFDEVMDTIRDYYRLMGRSLEEWSALCDWVAAAVDDEGRAYCAGLRGSLGE